MVIFFSNWFFRLLQNTGCNKRNTGNNRLWNVSYRNISIFNYWWKILFLFIIKLSFWGWSHFIYYSSIAHRFSVVGWGILFLFILVYINFHSLFYCLFWNLLILKLQLRDQWIFLKLIFILNGFNIKFFLYFSIFSWFFLFLYISLLFFELYSTSRRRYYLGWWIFQPSTYYFLLSLKVSKTSLFLRTDRVRIIISQHRFRFITINYIFDSYRILLISSNWILIFKPIVKLRDFIRLSDSLI